MLKDKPLLKVLAVIFFPLTAVYCVIHTFGKEFTTFIGSLLILIVGVGLGIYFYIQYPTEISNFLSNIKEIAKTIFKFW